MLGAWAPSQPGCGCSLPPPALPHCPPAAAFTLAWAFLYQKTQSPLEYCVVYLAAPVAAGLFGGWAFMGWQQWDAQRRRQQRRVRAKDD